MGGEYREAPRYEFTPTFLEPQLLRAEWRLPQEAASLFQQLRGITPPEAPTLSPLSQYLGGIGQIAYQQVMPEFIRAGMGQAPEPIARELGRTMGPEMMRRALEYETLRTGLPLEYFRSRLAPLEAATRVLGMGQFITPTPVFPQVLYPQYYEPQMMYQPGFLDYLGGILGGAGALLGGLFGRRGR